MAFCGASYSCLCTDSEVAKVTTDLKELYNQLDEDSLELITQLVQYTSSERWPTVDGTAILQI